MVCAQHYRDPLRAQTSRTSVSTRKTAALDKNVALTAAEWFVFNLYLLRSKLFQQRKRSTQLVSLVVAPIKQRSYHRDRDKQRRFTTISPHSSPESMMTSPSNLNTLFWGGSNLSKLANILWHYWYILKVLVLVFKMYRSESSPLLTIFAWS